MKFAQTERGNARGEQNYMAAVFTHFLTQKYTPLSIRTTDPVKNQPTAPEKHIQ